MNTTNSVRNIPAAIRALLDREGITATEFAATIGVSSTSVSYWLNGKNRIHPKMVASIRKVYPDFLRDDWRMFAECKPFDGAVIETRYNNDVSHIELAYYSGGVLYTIRKQDGGFYRENGSSDYSNTNSLWRYPNSN